MKKKYSLNYDIIFADERCDAICDILDELDTDPNTTDLEQMADYILFGKDDTLLSAVDTKTISVPKRRYNSFATKAESNESLDGLLEDPMVAQDIENTAKPVGPENKSPYKVCRQEIRRTTYAEDGSILTYGDDFDNYGNPIPFMRELWESIDRWTERYDMYRGRIEPNEWVLAHPISKYNLYKLQHFLIDLRRQQYYIKDVYNPTLHFFNVKPASHSRIDYDCNTGLWLSPAEWCARKRHPHARDLEQPSYAEAPTNHKTGTLYWKLSDNKLDYEDPTHILALLDNYVSLLKRCYAHPDSDMRQICWDIEYLIENADLTDVEQFLLEQRVAHRNIFVIQKVLEEENIALSDTQLRHIMRTVVPRKLANTAKRLRLESEVATGKRPTIKCTKCGRQLPKDPMYFSRAKDKKTGYCSQCKECQKRQRDSNKRPAREVKI